MTSTLRSVSVTAALLGALAIAGCSSAPAADPAPTTSETPSSPAPEVTATKTPAAESGNRASWAANPLDLGTLVGEGSEGSWQVQVFRVGNGTTTTDGIWVLPESGDPVMPAGSTMTVYNVVVMNTGDTVQRLSGTEGIMVEHAGVEDYAAVLGSNEDALFTEQGLSRLAYDLDALDTLPVYGEEKAYELAPGEAFGAAISTWADPGALKVSATLNVMDEQGKRLVDQAAIIDVAVTQE